MRFHLLISESGLPAFCSFVSADLDIANLTGKSEEGSPQPTVSGF